MNRLTVLDVFCGAGGFSEGFRQQGFDIVRGVDRWQPAIDTFNHNFGLNCSTQDVLEFLDSVEAIEALPDTDIILGSPPCVTFSSSNISGKADKSSGITLTQTFLRIVAVKKWKRGSKLQAWFMENVPRSVKHLAAEYSFEDLGLAEWALDNKIGPSKIAIRLEGNQEVVNSADYGSAQARKRVITGEIGRKGLLIPRPSHAEAPKLYTQLWRTVAHVKGALPDPALSQPPDITVDPNYSTVTIKGEHLSDHFYDTGLYEAEWKLSRYWKTNHPYMGRMSFPENDERPSRTVTATKIGSSREALIYRSSRPIQGDGEYRTPTVREAACLMGFPITYQFKGGEGTKWRLVGNAVCPSVARAFASRVLEELGIEPPIVPIVNGEVNLDGIENLNTFTAKVFDGPPTKNKNSRFRRHPFKDGNMTVTLSNYDIERKDENGLKWTTSVQYGTGEGFPTHKYPDNYYLEIEDIVTRLSCGDEFLSKVEELVRRTAPGPRLQELYESQTTTDEFSEPTELVENLAHIISGLDLEHTVFEQNGHGIFEGKKAVPTKQLLALYGVNRICSTANRETSEK